MVSWSVLHEYWLGKVWEEEDGEEVDWPGMPKPGHWARGGPPAFSLLLGWIHGDARGECGCKGRCWAMLGSKASPPSWKEVGG